MAMPSVVNAWAAPRTQPGQGVVALAVVDGVAELVEHRVHPPLARLDVAEHAHVAGAVDVDAERVLALAFARVQVAVPEHGAHVEAEAVVGAQRQGFEVGLGEEVVDRDRALGGRALEERVVVVPRAQVVGGAPEAAGERRVDLALPGRERLRGDPVDVVEGGEQAGLVELAGRQREGEVVAGAEVARRLVAQPGELADAVGDFGTDLLRRLPRRPPFVGVVAGAEDLGDGVVVDPPAVDAPAEVVERRLHRGLELHDGATEVGRHLVGHERVVEHVELASEQGIGGGVAGDVVAGGPHRGEGVGVGEVASGGRARPRCAGRPPPTTTGCSTPTTPRPARPRAVGARLRCGRRGQREARARRDSREVAEPDPWRDGTGGAESTIGAARRGSGGSGRGEDGAGVAGQGLVDHLPLEGDRGLAPGHGLVVGGEQAPGPVELLGRRREGAVGQRDLGGVDAELAPVADGAPEGGVGEEVVLGVELGDDLVDGEDAGEPGRQRDAGPRVQDLGPSRRAHTAQVGDEVLGAEVPRPPPVGAGAPAPARPPRHSPDRRARAGARGRHVRARRPRCRAVPATRAWAR